VGAFHMGGRNIALASTLEKFTHLMPELRLSTPSWQAAFQIHFAQAPHYGRDTVWLAGDAAHVHSPVGGRGMNMGMADAFALAGAISAERPQDYEQMRHPITADFIRLNRRMSAIPALQGMSGALVRRAARFMAAHFTDTVRRTVGQVAGL
jgi:2-polyprenyl-6-methoxyphenol hydroxylase-like FAD-dependent oxidoreductase